MIARRKDGYPARKQQLRELNISGKDLHKYSTKKRINAYLMTGVDSAQ